MPPAAANRATARRPSPGQLALPLPATPSPPATPRKVPPIPPRWVASGRTIERPPLSQFVFLSMLLHALFIALFGAPSGGSREGRAMWGSLDVKLVGPFRETRSPFTLERDYALPGAPRSSPPEVALPPPVPLPPPQQAIVAAPAPRAVEPPAPVTPPAVAPTPAAAPRPPTPARAPARFPRVLDKIIERKADRRRVDKVPPPTELAPAPVTPPVPVAPLEPAAIPAPPPEALVPAAPPKPEPAPPPEPIKVPEPIQAAEPVQLPEPIKAPDLIAPVETPVVPAVPAIPPAARPPVEVQAIPVPKPVETVTPPKAEQAPKIEPPPKPVEQAQPVEVPVVKPPTALERALQPPREPTIEERKAPKVEPPSVPRAETTPSFTAPKAQGRGPSDKPFPEGRGDTGYDPTARGPGLDLDAMRKRAASMAREGSGQRALLPFPMPPIPEKKSKLQEAFDKAHKPDCATAYKDLGLAAVVPLIANEFGEGNCKW